MQDLDPSDICKKKFLNPLKRIRVIIRTPTHGRTDGQTDRRTDEQGESSIPPPQLRCGGYNKWELSHFPNLTVMIMYCFHNNNPVHFTIIKDLQMIDLKFAFRSMIDRSGFDRSDRSFSRIVWPLPYSTVGDFLDPNIRVIRGPYCISTNAGLWSVGPLGTNFSETWNKIRYASLKKIHL